MSLKKLTLKTRHEHQGKRLDQVLSEWLPQALARPVSKGKARKLIMAGAVYLNGKRVRIASKELLANAKIEVMVDLDKLSDDGRARDLPFTMTPEHILFEDEYIIAVNKPPGLPTQPTLDEARINLFASVKKFMAGRDGIAQSYVGLHHRLDRDTSGVVLFTKDPKANAGVAALFSEHRAVKTYQALSLRINSSSPFKEETWIIKNYLKRSTQGGNKKSFYASARSGGDFAHTEFRVLERVPAGECPQFVWIEAKPKTGRTHQIRVHLSEYGLPILGDHTYGPHEKIIDSSRMMLHAANLTFPHPIHQTEVSISSPLPEDFVQCLARLRRQPARS